MTKEKKNEFTLRISQANKSELIIILYEMTICYIEDVINLSHASDTGVANVDNKTEFQIAIKRATGCIEEMQANLHYEYELAKNLKQIYLYMKKQLRMASVTGDVSTLGTVIKELSSLRDAYESIKAIDTSGAIMSHTQTVVTGMTYDKNSILDSLTTEYTGRGYRV